MTPPVARTAARVQVALAAGTFPTVLILGIFVTPFDWELAFILGLAAMSAAMFLSALFVPIAGLVLSWMGIGRGRE